MKLPPPWLIPIRAIGSVVSIIIMCPRGDLIVSGAIGIKPSVVQAPPAANDH